MNPLTPFAAHGLPVSVNASIRFSERDIFLHFSVHDPGHRLHDSLTPGEWTGTDLRRADGLWQTTCLEAFWGEPGKTSYWELNLSAAKPEWNLYRFEDYRQPQPPQACEDFALAHLRRTASELHCRLISPQLLPPMEASLCAVLKTAGGTIYCAARHAGPKADFHDRGSFILR